MVLRWCRNRRNPLSSAIQTFECLFRPWNERHRNFCIITKGMIVKWVYYLQSYSIFFTRRHFPFLFFVRVIEVVSLVVTIMVIAKHWWTCWDLRFSRGRNTDIWKGNMGSLFHLVVHVSYFDQIFLQNTWICNVYIPHRNKSINIFSFANIYSLVLGH